MDVTLRFLASRRLCVHVVDDEYGRGGGGRMGCWLDEYGRMHVYTASFITTSHC